MRRVQVGRSVHVLSAMLACAVPRATLAQMPAQDGRVILATRLGGDSAQAALVNLRAGGLYRVAVQPASAAIRLKAPGLGSGPAQILTTRALTAGDSVPGGSGFLVTARRTADHLVELTDRADPVNVTIAVVFLPPGADARPGSATLIFSEQVGPSPSFVTLDSGVVYRIIPVDGVVYLAPTRLDRPPVSFAALVRGGGAGIPFVPVVAGEYRVSSSDNVAVRIYREERDQVENACLRDSNQPGCRGGFMERYERRRESIAIVLLSLVVVLLVINQ